MLSLFVGSLVDLATVHSEAMVIRRMRSAMAVVQLVGAIAVLIDVYKRQLILNPSMRFLWMLLFCAPIALAQPAIDFSFAGYAGGGESAPFVPGAISVRPTGGDDTALLQAALDRVAALPPSSDGFRGAVLLREGRYRVAGHLEMRAGGVVLRGSVNATICLLYTSRCV